MDNWSRSDAQAYAKNWIDAWNRYDIDAILSHYVDDVVFLSPVAAQRVGHGRVIGREALRGYWSAGLAAQPQLRCELDTVHISAHRGRSFQMIVDGLSAGS